MKANSLCDYLLEHQVRAESAVESLLESDVYGFVLLNGKSQPFSGSLYASLRSVGKGWERHQSNYKAALVDMGAMVAFYSPYEKRWSVYLKSTDKASLAKLGKSMATKNNDEVDVYERNTKPEAGWTDYYLFSGRVMQTTPKQLASGDLSGHVDSSKWWDSGLFVISPKGKVEEVKDHEQYFRTRLSTSVDKAVEEGWATLTNWDWTRSEKPSRHWGVRYSKSRFKAKKALTDLLLKLPGQDTLTVYNADRENAEDTTIKAFISQL